MIAQYLVNHSFLFRPKADILVKRRIRNAEEEALNDDEEEVEPDSKADDVGSGATPGDEAIPSAREGSADEREEVGKASEDGDDSKKQSGPRKSSRIKRSATSNGADDDATPQPSRKSQRIQKDISPTGRPKRKLTATAAGSGVGNKVCLMPLNDIVLPNS
jgi:hypothetical protein